MREQTIEVMRIYHAAQERPSSFGYAQKPEAPMEKMPESKIWKVSVRSQKGQHHIEAANVKDADGKLVFMDVQGNPVGSFCSKDVHGYSLESGAELTISRSRSKACAARTPDVKIVKMVSCPADEKGQW